MVRISDIQENCVIWDNVPYCQIDENDIDTYLLKVNDILFARTGGTVGKSFLVEEVLEKAIYAGYLIRTRYSSIFQCRSIITILNRLGYITPTFPFPPIRYLERNLLIYALHLPCGEELLIMGIQRT